MNTSLKFFLASALMLPAFNVSARQNAPADFSIDESSVRIEAIASDTLPPYLERTSTSRGGPIITPKRIINLAFKIYDIIQKNRPVVNITTDYANAVPEDLSHWTQLTGWQGPSSPAYMFSAKNRAGMEIVKATYKVHYLWGGSYKGKGKYLTGVTIEPMSITTAWACNLDLAAEVPDSSIINAGTDEDPVASMDVHLNWKLRTFTRKIEKKAVYRVRGDGLIQELGPLFSRGLEAQSAAKIKAVTEKLENIKFD